MKITGDDREVFDFSPLTEVDDNTWVMEVVLPKPASTAGWVHLPLSEVQALHTWLGAQLDPEAASPTYVYGQWIGDSHPLLPALTELTNRASDHDRDGVLLSRQIMNRVLAALITLGTEQPRRVSARPTDPVTSHDGARSVQRRAGSQAHRLLREYAAIALEYGLGYVGSGGGLTDSEARAHAGLPERSCYWKRCSELRQDGLIRDTGQVRPDADTGEARIVCAITEAGAAELARLGGGS